jgi:hypothetical protein
MPGAGTCAFAWASGVSPVASRQAGTWVRAAAALALLQLCAGSPAAAAPADAVAFPLQDSRLVVTLRGGSRLADEALVGLELKLGGGAANYVIRIDDVAPDGQSLAPYHEACVRVVRADYCGDGTPHTVPGVAIEMFDRAGVHTRRDPGYGTFEALWGPDGAVCLARARRPEFPLVEILRQCPRLADLPPADCAALGTLPGALLGNRS